MATIPETIAIAKVSQYLVTDDIGKGNLFYARALNPYLPFLIYRVRKSLEWAYSLDTTYSLLGAVANYLLYLCGGYALTAQAIISGASGGIVTPGTPVSQNSTYHRIRFIVGASGSPMAAGDTVYTLFDTPTPGTIMVFLDEQLVYSDITTQQSYTTTYGNTSTLITFLQGLDNNQKVEIHYWRPVAGVSPTASAVGIGQYIFIAVADNTTTTGAISGLVGASIISVQRDIFGLSTSEWSFDDSTGTLTLLGGGSNFLDTGGRLYILYSLPL